MGDREQGPIRRDNEVAHSTREGEEEGGRQAIKRFHNVPQTIVSGKNYLKKAHNKLGSPEILKFVRDHNFRKMGFITTDKTVVAREYICKGNNIVSIAEKVLNAAYRREMMIHLYIDELGDFLTFDPVIVFERGETNVRDGELFYNIPAHMGTKPDDGRKMTRLDDFEGGG